MNVAQGLRRTVQPSARFDYIAQPEVLQCRSTQDPTHPNANVDKDHQDVLKMTKDMKGWGRGENESTGERKELASLLNDSESMKEGMKKGKSQDE